MNQQNCAIVISKISAQMMMKQNDAFSAMCKRMTTWRRWNDFENFYFISDDGMINVRQGHEVRLDLYGIGLTKDSEVKLTSSVASAGHACKSQGLHVQVPVNFRPELLK